MNIDLLIFIMSIIMIIVPATYLFLINKINRAIESHEKESPTVTDDDIAANDVAIPSVLRVRAIAFVRCSLQMGAPSPVPIYEDSTFIKIKYFFHKTFGSPPKTCPENHCWWRN